MNKNEKLFEENKMLTLSMKKGKENRLEKLNHALMKCKVQDCGKFFESSFGLMKHQKKEHPNAIIGQIKEACSICGKMVVQMDKHFKTVHKELFGEQRCEICQQLFGNDVKKHKGQCNSCPVC